MQRLRFSRASACSSRISSISGSSPSDLPVSTRLADHRSTASTSASNKSPSCESVRLAEQNLYARARDLVGDRNPREHEFIVQLRSFDSGKSGANLGVAILIALCSGLLGRSLKGGLAIVGGLNLGGSVELVHNPIEVMELAMEKGAGMVLLPVSCRRALVDLSDDVTTRVQSFFYLDARAPCGRR
jgi:ATP-dependent Lon protease